MIIHDKINELNNLNGEVKRCQEELDKVSAKQKSLSEEVIPSLLDTEDLHGIKTNDFDVEIKSRFYPNLPKQSKEREIAYKWLCENGFKDAFTYQVHVHFNDHEEAIEYSKQTPNSTVMRDIHFKTLEALVNEQIELNEDFPIDLFNAYEKRTTRINKR